MAWRQEERNLVRRLIKQDPMVKKSAIDIRGFKKGGSQSNYDQFFSHKSHP
jgi:hypothetical protein